MSEKKTRKNLEDGLQLSGNVKSLLRRDIVVSVGEVRSTLVSGGGITWRGSGKPVKLTTVGRLNGFFMLCEPATKITEEQAAAVLENMPVRQYRRYERNLATGPRDKDQPMVYYVVSRNAAIVARDRYRDLRDLLVPVGGFHLDKQAMYVGFAPAWLLFEEESQK